ncbi:MAG: spore coat protein U domain-containing protein [Myxococcales bacterium]|nr:spore coat U domain-containing protein [Myxococcales bacterium]
MSRKLAVPLALAAAFAMRDASAAFPTQQFQAKAVVAGNCTVSESGILDFGNYDPLTVNASAAQAGSGASLSLLCTRGSHPHVAMDNGANGGRQLFTGTGGANQQLTYDIVMPSGNGASATATATSWGSTVATKYDVGVTTVAPTVATVVEIFGTIAGGQDVIPGTYTDTVTATVDF